MNLCACVCILVQEWDCQENVDLTQDYSVSWDDLDELETERVSSGRNGCKGVYRRDGDCVRVQ